MSTRGPGARLTWAATGIGVTVVLALVLPGFVFARALPTPASVVYGDAVWGPGKVPAPPITLRDTAGRLISLRQLRGRVVVLTFMDSLCRTDCPVEAAELAEVHRRLGQSTPFTTVVVSTDPGGDTRRHVRAFLDRYRIHFPVLWLVGTRAQLQRVWRAYQIDVTSASTHSSALYLIGRSGDERAGFGVPFPPTDLMHDLRALDAHWHARWALPWAL
ncbi:MAG TPA: SCO family protein [Candidatus Dormibacteraeota bacterium]|nr:SCO family protein [Candidatus Dormibacteraeota bacterium]